MVYQKEKPDPAAVIQRAKKARAECISVWEEEKKETKMKPHSEENWQTPDIRWIKVNIDGAYNAETDEAGLGVIMRNEKGEVVGGLDKSTHTQIFLQKHWP